MNPRRPGKTDPETAAAAHKPTLSSSQLVTGPVRKTLFILAMPVLGEQILNTLVGTFDTYLAGRFSAAATSAIGVAAYAGWLASMIVMLIGTGTTALVSRCEGAGDHDEANRFAAQSMTLAALLGVLVFALLYTIAPAFARYLNMTGDAYDLTVQYLQFDAIGHTLMSLTLVGCAALRGVGNMRAPMVIFAIVNAINVVASCTFVFGLGPFQEMGVPGIVIGTVTAKTVGAILTVAVLLRGRSGLQLKLPEMRLTLQRIRRILRIGIPAAADGAFMWGGHFVLLGIIASLAGPPLGEAYFAAHIIAVRVEAFTYLPAVAWAAATATMIGQALGAEDFSRARRVGHEGVLQCGLLSCLVAALFYFGAEFIYYHMSADELVRSKGAAPFRILALFQPLLVISIVYVGGLRGAGDTRFPLLITLVGSVVIRLSLGYYCGIVLNGGLLGAWMGMFGDMVWRAIAASIRFTRGQWVYIKV